MHKLDQGVKCFFRHPEKTWVIGTIESKDGNVFSCKDEDGDSASKLKIEDVFPYNPASLDPNINDLLELTDMHEAIVLNVLKLRYQQDLIYTYIGSLVIALNPFKFTIPWYQNDMMPKYLTEGKVVVSQKPHSWSVAHSSYWRMCDYNTPQCILISGESGAGKTEGAKIVLKYLGEVSAIRGGEAQRDACASVNKKLIQASPILEAFGNAKTVRNDNSSRFGKFMQIGFDGSGFLVGALITEYLLEKSRVITAGPEERVYHAFYQLVCGASSDQKSKWKLPNAEAFPMLTSGNAPVIPGVDDGEDYRINVEAMDVVGFTAEEKEQVWRSVAAVLHLSTIQFDQNDKEESKVKNKDKLTHTAELFHLEPEVLEKALTEQEIKTKNETLVKKYKKGAAEDCRDSVCKLVYEKTFAWIVRKVNSTTACADAQKNWIGLLDIFGFEDFKVNSFEQLCINLANEQLQNHYNDYVFKKDVEECRAEGINVDSIEFQDNTPCLELITSKMGVLGMLDEECSLGNGTDAGYIDKVTNSNGKSPHFIKPKLMKDAFCIKHYAATVKYEVKNWLEKNRDQIKDDIRHCFRSSKCPFVADLLPAPIDKKGRDPTVGGIFRKSLQDLLALINQTQPNWIRCIKPDPRKKPGLFNNRTVLEQLTSSGVIETIKMRKAGYAYRIPFEQFYGRFVVFLSERAKDKSPETLIACCKKILGVLEFTDFDAQAGKKKIFLRIHAYTKLEEEKDKRMISFYLTLQRCMRAKFSEMKAWRQRKLLAVKLIQKEARTYLQLSAATRAEREERRKHLALQHTVEREHLEKEEQEARKEEEEQADQFWIEFWEMEAKEKHLAANAEMVNLDRHEDSVRQGKEQEEEQARDHLWDLFDEGIEEAIKLEEERWARLRAAWEKERQVIIAGEEQNRQDIEEEEMLLREELWQYWIPIQEQIFAEIQHRVEVRRRRREKIASMQAAREREIERLEAQRKADMAAESQKYKQWELKKHLTHMTKEEKKQKMEQTAKQLQQQYKLGEVRQPGSGVVESELGIMSFDDYSARWREAYWKDRLTSERGTHKQQSPTSRNQASPPSATTRGGARHTMDYHTASNYVDINRYYK